VSTQLVAGKDLAVLFIKIQLLFILSLDFISKLLNQIIIHYKSSIQLLI